MILEEMFVCYSLSYLLLFAMYKETLQILLVPLTLYRQLLRSTGCISLRDMAADNHEASLRSSVERSSNMLSNWQS